MSNYNPSRNRKIIHNTKTTNMVPRWFIVIVVIAGLLQIGIVETPFLGPGFFVGTLLSVLPAVLAWFLALRLNRIVSSPIGLLVWIFLWGAFVATLVAGYVNTFVSEASTDAIGAIISAPLIEEVMKFSALAFIIGLTGAVDNPLSGCVAGILVGGGFSVFEDVSYVLMSTDNNTAFSTSIFRVFVSPLIHMSTTALAGWFVGGKVLRGENWKYSLISILIPSMAIHCLWNVGASFLGGFLIIIGLGHTVVSLYLVKVANRKTEEFIIEGQKIANQSGYFEENDQLLLQRKLDDKRMKLGGSTAARYQDYVRALIMVSMASNIYKTMPLHYLNELHIARHALKG